MGPQRLLDGKLFVSSRDSTDSERANRMSAVNYFVDPSPCEVYAIPYVPRAHACTSIARMQLECVTRLVASSMGKVLKNVSYQCVEC